MEIRMVRAAFRMDIDPESWSKAGLKVRTGRQEQSRYMAKNAAGPLHCSSIRRVKNG